MIIKAKDICEEGSVGDEGGAVHLEVLVEVEVRHPAVEGLRVLEDETVRVLHLERDIFRRTVDLLCH